MIAKEDAPRCVATPVGRTAILVTVVSLSTRHARRPADNVRMCLAATVIMATLMAGCGSGKPASSSVAGVMAAARNVSQKVEAGSYRQVCESLTASERAELDMWRKDGCIGLLTVGQVFAHIASGRGVGLLFEAKMLAAREAIVIRHGAAFDKGRIVARYEGNRWHFEDSERGALLGVSHLRTESERAVRSLEESGGSVSEIDRAANVGME